MKMEIYHCNMIVLIYNQETKQATLHDDIPSYPDMYAGMPWAYINAESILFYPVYFNSEHEIAVIISKKIGE